MAHINLLPWREELRKQKQRDFMSIAAGSAVLMGLVVLYVHMHINGLIENQQGRNEYLKTEIRKVELKIKEIKELEKQKQKLISRMRIIERLQSHRPEIVYTFDELVRIVPDGLYLTSLIQKGNKIIIEGSAQSNARVSAFMRGLDSSESFGSPTLDFIRAASKGVDRSRIFKLQVSGRSQERSSQEQ